MPMRDKVVQEEFFFWELRSYGESTSARTSPDDPRGGRKPNAVGGLPLRPGFGSCLVVGFALIFWQLSSKPETTVS